MAEQRYTLSLPEAVYKEIREKADSSNTSIKEVVRQCLKFGLVAMKLSDNPDVQLLLREKIASSEDDSSEFKETRLKFIW